MSTVKDRLDKLTPAQKLALLKRLAQQKNNITERIMPLKVDDQDIPLSFAQQRLWFLYQLEGASATYHIPFALRMKGILDLEILSAAFNEIIRRHDSLRTNFIAHDGDARQMISRFKPIKIDTIQAKEHNYIDLAQIEAHRAFDLSKDQLIRIKLLKIDETDHILLITMHHIISDGWSTGIIIKELTSLYQSYLHGIKSKLDDLTIQYSDFSVWQRNKLQGETWQDLMSYWKNQLSDLPTMLSLPTDHPRPAMQTYAGDVYRFNLDENLVSRLNTFSIEHDVTLYMTMLSAFYVLLNKYSKQNDLVIGTPIANRNHPDIENLIGFFVNTLVLRVNVRELDKFTDVLRRVKAVTLGAFEHQDLPFDQLVKELQPERNTSHSPLFQVMFEMQNSLQEKITLGDLDITPIEHDVRVAKFDITLTFEMHDGQLRGLIEYNTDLFEKSTIVKFVEHYTNVLNVILINPEIVVSSLSVLSDSEKHKLIYENNQKIFEFPIDKSVHALFEAQVERTPYAIAASCDGVEITYAELDSKANILANALIALNVVNECRIALLLDRSIEYLIAMIAVLKSGAAFVPLDPNANIKRSQDIVQECQPFLMISSVPHAKNAYDLMTENVILIEEVLRNNHHYTKPEVSVYPSSLAYVIFTSGSTGKPKGVMIQHDGMVNHLYAKIQDLDIKHTDVIGQIAVQTFDVSIWQFICANLVGGRTAILSGDNAWEPRLLLKKIEQEGITIIESVPSHTKVILDAQEANPEHYDLSSLRIYMSNAEPLTPEQCDRWFRSNPGITMVNAYGATECSDDTHHLHLSSMKDITLPYVPVRDPLPNLQAYILDDAMELVPVGVRGMIYIGGIGVGRGYYNDPIKTASSYVPNPFSTNPGERLYKTGDVARFVKDGMIEFLGRSDFQVKINGFRIEIGEIESVLLEHRAIASAVVIAKKDERDEYYLVSYVIPKKYPAPTLEDIREYCQTRLPHYMVPACILFMDVFPLSPNGKVDRKQLPQPTKHDFNAQVEYVAPRNAIELAMVDLWSAVLHKEKIGIHDHFFKMGGHSLLAAELVIKMQNALNTPIALRQLFECPTIASLADSLHLQKNEDEKKINSDVANVKKYPAQEYYDLAPCQVPEWYAYQLDKTSPVYNISFSDLFYKNLDIHVYIQAWQMILDRHENFRICFDYKDGRPVQRLLDPIRLNINDTLIDKKSISIDQIDAVAGQLAFDYSNTAFDFETGPLFKLKIACYPDNQYQLLFVVHHIIWDETSTINLFKELAEFYNALLVNRQPQLVELKLSYFDYVCWMNESIHSGVFEEHRKYWLELYRNLPPALDIPSDYPRPAMLTFNGESVSNWFSRETLRNLHPYLEKHNVTLFMFMMSIIDLYLYRITGQNDIVIGSPIAGRDHESFKPILGLFASPMPIRCNIADSMTFTDLLYHIKTRSLEAFEHHYYPTNKVIEELDHVKDLSRPKLFSVMYGVQNNKTEAFEATEFDGVERFIKNLYGAEANSARFDLTLVVDQWGSDIAFNCIFNTDIFKKSTVQRMMDEMMYLVKEVVEDSDKVLSQYSLLSHHKYLQLLNESAYATLSYPDATIHHLFENQVEKSPNNLAIVWNNHKMSYHDLNIAANQLAHYLDKQGVKPGQPVGVLLQASPNMIVSLLAILKLSAHYVPISVEYPVNRIHDILQSAAIKHLISDNTYLNELEAYDGQRICLDKSAEVIKSQDSSNLIDHCSHEDIAYIIFTSGTTGIPKGIPIHHGGVVNLLYSTQNDYQLTYADSVLALTPFTFDASILDIFWPLSFGATIVIPQSEVFKNPKAIATSIQTNHITILQCVPIMLEALIDTGSNMDSLRLVISGGAYLSRVLRDKFYTHFNCKLMNHYGPTEVTVDASRFDCSEDFEGNIVPIGKPIANTQIFILDPYLNLVPKGVVGEIYVASPGLARGYLNDDLKTQQSFIKTLFFDKPIRLYKTGDLGKLSDDGNVYYIGRIDKQVKIRGNRVELEEIENALSKHVHIKNAAVKYYSRDAADGQLVAYLDYQDNFNSLYVAGVRYQLFTVSERPELARLLHAGHTQAWPDYFAGSKVEKAYWPRLYTQFADYQFGLLTENNALAAFGNAAPIYWDGQLDSLPRGWDAALIESLESDKKANTLLIFAGIVTPEFQGKGLSTEILKAFKMLAKGHKLEKIVVAVRPTDKVQHPEMDFETWCYTRRTDGQLADNWLRIHERVGGKLLKVCLESQLVEGTIEQWEKWTGETISTDGYTMLSQTLQKVFVDKERDFVRYYDPAIWVEHYYSVTDNHAWQAFDNNHFRTFLSGFLPAYMIPEHYCVLPMLPLLENGKLNEKALPELSSIQHRIHVAAKTELQKALAELWCSILKVDRVGMTDDFFALGGQSLKVIQMLAEVATIYGVKIPLCQFYVNPTMKGLEVILSTDRSKNAPQLTCSFQ